MKGPRFLSWVMAPSATTCLTVTCAPEPLSRHVPAAALWPRASPASARAPSWKDLRRDNRHLLRSALFLLCLCLYWNSLDCGFVFDDRATILENRDLRPQSPWTNLLWNDFWGTPIHTEASHKSYRPLTVATFRVNTALSQNSAAGFHLVKAVLHGVSTLLFLHTCSKVGRLSEEVGTLAAVLFAIHPVSWEFREKWSPIIISFDL